MKCNFWLFIGLSLLLVACSTPAEKGQDEPFIGGQGNTSLNNTISGEVIAGEEEIPQISSDQSAPTKGSDCYAEGVHPIGESIAVKFKDITTYAEVMSWFCNGAAFEDILNALTTEELSNVKAKDLLEMVAQGKSWATIWIDLGITEE